MGIAKTTWLLACAAVLGGSIVAPSASADTLGSDLSGTPQFAIACDAACIIFGFEGPANPSGTQPTPIAARADGTVTQVQVRSGDAVPIEFVRMELVGNQLKLKSAEPLGMTSGNTMEYPVHTFGPVNIPVEEDEVLGVRATPQSMGGVTLGGYNTPGEGGTGVIDPSPPEGGQAAPNKGGVEQMPAIRIEIDYGGQQKQDADVSVIKNRVDDDRPGRSDARSVGESLNYELFVRNNGPADAKGVTLTDTYGRGLALEKLKVIAPAQGSAPNCKSSAGAGPGTITCKIGDLPKGATRAFKLFFKVTGRPSALHPDQINKGVKSNRGDNRAEYNTAVVASASPDDPVLSNNTDFVATDIVGYAHCGGRHFFGTPKRNDLKGSKRADVIIAMGAADRLRGLAGRDCLFGNEGSDVLIGGAKPDLLVGGTGRNRYRTADGAKDVIVCESRKDRGVVDAEDELQGDCRRKRFNVV